LTIAAFMPHALSFISALCYNNGERRIVPIGSEHTYVVSAWLSEGKFLNQQETEMTAYFIGEHKITDAAKYEEYLRQVAPMIKRFGGRYITRVGTHKVLEGQWEPNRVVIVEFPDMVALKQWYHSREYQPLAALRQSASDDILIAVEGI
jgi:uncharacterized protein (DUF1330 family)